MNSLLLIHAEDFQNPKVSEVWAKMQGCPFSEASVYLKKSWGLLSERLSTDDAARLVEAFQKKGLDIQSVPSSDLTIPPAVQPVKFLRFSTAALSLQNGATEATQPWGDLKALFAYALNESFTKTTKITHGPSPSEKLAKTAILLGTGIPLPMSRKKTVEKTVTHHELSFFMDLIFASPLRRFRVDGQHLDYSFLGPKKEMGAQGNFRLLFEELKARVPQAFLNKGSRVLAARQPVSTMGYETVDDVERETKWYLSLQGMK